jgi:hypothetical protein
MEEAATQSNAVARLPVFGRLFGNRAESDGTTLHNPAIKAPPAALAEQHYVANKVASAQRRLCWKDSRRNEETSSGSSKSLKAMPGTLQGKTGWYMCQGGKVAHFTKSDSGGWTQTYNNKMAQQKWWEAVALREDKPATCLPRRFFGSSATRAQHKQIEPARRRVRLAPVHPTWSGTDAEDFISLQEQEQLDLALAVSASEQ